MTIRTALVAFICNSWILLAVVGCDKTGSAGLAMDAAADVPVGSDATAGGATGGTGGGGGNGGSWGGGTDASGAGMGGSSTRGSGGATGGSGGIATIGSHATGGSGGITTGETGGTRARGASGGSGGIAVGGAGGGGAVGRGDASAGGAGVDVGVFAGGAGGGGIGGTISTGGIVGTGGSAANGCPSNPPTHGANCTHSGYDPCYYEDCAGSGRTLANCTSGAWQVTTGACGPVMCPGTCATGQVCLRVQSGYLTQDCVTPTCGTGPVTPQCVPGVKGSCSVSASIAAGATIGCNNCSGSGGCQ
jgi:hypothetical protein